jgi:DNA phosphorothioation-dependent restriction protein DptG
MSELQFNEPTKNYSFNTTNHAWVFPRAGTAVKLDQVREELLSYEGVLGAIIRCSSGFESQPPDTEKLFEQCLTHVQKHVSTDCEAELASVLRDLYFETGSNKLRRFAFASLAYLQPDSQVPKNSLSSILSLGEFFSRVFMPPNLAAVGGKEHMHVLDRVMLEALPKLKTTSEMDLYPVMRKFESSLVSEFQKDLGVLLQHDGLFLTHIDSLSRFYLFQYLTEIVRYLNRSIESLRTGTIYGSAAIQGLHFLIEDERASASRIGVAEGWRSVKDGFAKVFSHINCLELLNHLKLPGQGPLDYSTFASLHSPSNLDTMRRLAASFVEVASSRGNSKVKFACGKELLEDVNRAKSCADAVYYIWYWIDYEINHSGRGRVVSDIAKWFSGFGQGTLLQQRGPLGYISVLPLTCLHLLVTVVVKTSQEERVRLKDLWEGLARRGVLLDEGSKRSVISNLEEIGVLEAKSDSGDAKYVRAPF